MNTANTAAVTAPEHASIEAFAQYMLDDDRTVFTLPDVARVAAGAHVPNGDVIAELRAYGFTYKAPRVGVVEPRGFKSNNNNRWQGNPGAGGGGGDSLTGFAGRAG